MSFELRKIPNAPRYWVSQCADVWGPMRQYPEYLTRMKPRGGGVKIRFENQGPEKCFHFVPVAELVKQVFGTEPKGSDGLSGAKELWRLDDEGHSFKSDDCHYLSRVEKLNGVKIVTDVMQLRFKL